MIYRVNQGFAEDKINPIINKPYDSSWIVFCLTDSNDYQMMCGSNNNSAYTIKISKNYPHWMLSVGDFTQFQESKNKNIILSINLDDLEKAQRKYIGHSYNENFLRDYEPDVLIHSTTYENWISIQADCYLKSWNMLKKEKLGWEEEPIGRQLGDPQDFSNYIMFSNGAVSSEIVVMSKQNRKITINQDMEYETGVRMYFDMKKIASDGLLVRDGIHLKVENMLSLDPYLLWYATWENVGLTSNISTPKEFTEKANLRFNALFKDRTKVF